jgi:hypothetical protein
VLGWYPIRRVVIFSGTFVGAARVDSFCFFSGTEMHPREIITTAASTATRISFLKYDHLLMTLTYVVL